MTSERTRPDRARRHAALILTAIVLVVSVVAALVRGEVGDAVIPFALLFAAGAPAVLEIWWRVRFPTLLVVLYALLLLGGPYLGSHLHFYGVVTVWDTVVHFYSGVPIALAAYFALDVLADRGGFTLPAWFEAIVVVAFSGFVALLWEMSEFASDLVIGTTAQNSNWDTMTDLVAGTGAAVLVVVVMLVRHRGRSSTEAQESAPVSTAPRG